MDQEDDACRLVWYVLQEPAAEASLIAKLKDGKGHPKIAASDAELKAAVGHVLSTK